MKTYTRALIMILLAWTTAACWPDAEQNLPPEEILEIHRQYGPLTDPGKYSFLYSGLPQSTEGLTSLIKKQLIHPFDAGQFLDQLPKDVSIEDRKFPSVERMLEILVNRDPEGLSSDRKPGDRLIVACVHHSLLFASILKHRGIPVRIRFGFATYIGGNSDYRVSHAICEVWDTQKKKWLLVDPDRRIVDLSRSRFEFAGQAWERLRDNRIHKDRYISSHGSTDRAVLHLLCHDFSSLLGNEFVYWEDPPIVNEYKSELSELGRVKLEILDRIAEMLAKPDENFSEMTQIYEEHSYLQQEQSRFSGEESEENFL